MNRDELRTLMAEAGLSAADEEIAGEILAETPDEEFDALVEVVRQPDGLKRLVDNYRDEAAQKEDVMDGAPDLVGRAADETADE